VRTDRSLDAIDAAPDWIPGETVERPELEAGSTD